MKPCRVLLRSLLLLATGCGLLLFGYASPASALLAAHQNYDGCSTCHNLHSSPGGALLDIADDPELLCMSCHGPGGVSSLQVVTHNLAGVASSANGYITCNECHNSHNNGQENSRTNADGSYNDKLVGLTLDYNSAPPLSVAAQIRKERVATGLGALKDVVFLLSPDDWERTESDDSGDGLGVCNACHDSIHNRAQDCTGCHAHDGGFAGAGDCTACHDGNGLSGTAEAVSVDSPHSTNTIFASTGETFTCENCHTAHEAGNIQIPNNNAVGIMYNSAGHNGISLGADDGNANDAVGTTQAEICWNCHDNFDPVVSEWGTNSGSGYDYGSLHSSAGDTTTSPGDHVNWTTGFWKSADFTYKNGPLNTRPVDGNANPGSNATGRGSASLHATGGTVGTQSNSLADISCAYCHDVHDTMGPTGKPYLRGTWTANPFPEDGAPRAGVASYASTDFGGVPRGGTGTGHPLSWSGNNKSGGWQIEQNNSSFSWTDYPTGASLCNNCHTAASIESSLGWTGHNAVVPGFAGSDAASNIFTTTKRGGSGGYLRGHMRHANTTPETGSWMYGLRSVEEGSGKNPPQYGIAPKINPARPQTGANLDLSSLLGVNVDAGTTDANFHSFPCSKCHNPHASRLPRLMITNCLDVRNNTWDDGIDPTSWAPISGTNGHTSKQLAYASSATNCHRYVNGSDPNRETNGSNETGWNSVTPW